MMKDGLAVAGILLAIMTYKVVRELTMSEEEKRRREVLANLDRDFMAAMKKAYESCEKWKARIVVLQLHYEVDLSHHCYFGC